MVRRGIAAVLALGLAAAWLAAAAGQEFRTWSDASGKHKIKAKFVECSEGNVTLEREDGSQVTIALKKLSEADQKVVAELQSGDESPFQPAKPAKRAAKAKKAEAEPREEQEEGEGTVQGQPKTVTPDWSGAKEVALTPAKDKWSLSIEAPEQPAPGRKLRPIVLPAKVDFFERTKGLAINPVSRRAVIGYVSDRPGGTRRPARSGPGGFGPGGLVPGGIVPPRVPGGPGPLNQGGQTRIVLCDLDKGKALGSCVTDGKMVPLALSDAGNQVLMRRDDFGPGNMDRLEIWTLTKSGIRKDLRWTPHDDQRIGGRDIVWARYIDEERVATLSGSGVLVVWKAASAKPLYFLRAQGGAYPALSPDRKYLALVVEKRIAVFDLAAGEVAVAQATPTEHFPFPVFAFTPKGSRLVCGAFDRIYVWDVATGALYRNIPLTGANVHIGNNLVCPSEDHVLVGNSLLVDIESQVKLWSYRGHEILEMLGEVCWFAVAGQPPGDSASALVPSPLPHPAARDRIQKAMETPDFFVLKPGTTVRVNVAGLGDAGEQEKAAAALAQKLQANGCQVGAGGAVELVASVEMGKPRKVSYSSFGPFGAGGQSYSVQEYVSRLKFVYQGQTAWEVACSSVPGFLHLRDGETIEQALRNSERPNYAWFNTVELPKVLQKPTPGAITLGASEVTVSGVR
jgi:hypothetical protein